MNDSRLVYSTGGNNNCPQCGKALRKCRCQRVDQIAEPQQATTALIQLQRKGRGGKEVTVVSGLSLNGMDLLALLQELKSRLGTGGTVKQQNLEIQGNRVDAIKSALSERGISAKISGG